MSEPKKEGGRPGSGELCRAPGCQKRKLGSSDLCAEHLNERLRLERETRDRVREKAGNWASWAAPGPTLDAVAGKAPTEDVEARARLVEELVAVRAELSRRLDAEVSKVPWPSILGGLGPKQAAKGLEGALESLSPEREMEAWRFVRGVLDGRGGDRAWREQALAGLDGAIREPARVLVEMMERLRRLGGEGAGSISGAIANVLGGAARGEGAGSISGALANALAGALAGTDSQQMRRKETVPVQAQDQETVPIARAPEPPSAEPADSSPAPSTPDALRASYAQGERVRADLEERAKHLAREAFEKGGDALRRGEEALREAVKPGGAFETAEKIARDAFTRGAGAFEDAQRRGVDPLDPQSLFAFASEALGAGASALKEALNPSLVKILTGGRIDPAAFRRGADKVAALGREGAQVFRRRLAGRYETDAYGVDRDLAAWSRHLLSALYAHWWRVDATGLVNVPARGPCVIVANRSLALPWDAAMIATALRDDRLPPRDARLLVLDWLAEVPFASELLGKTGVLLARAENLDRLLGEGEAVVLFPEGERALERPRRERYRLARFGKGEFVEAALRRGAPIVPCAVVGAEESSPALFRLGFLGRALGLPSLPAPLLPLPLPTRWRIRFGEPIDPRRALPPGAETDPARVAEAADGVREKVQALVEGLLGEREGIFS